ncbi:polyprenyl synthetase family protein [Pelagibacteraceae bacterium]|nr:polyprenyl synthetase family protein [Pelagibacteraceae bacterium]
MSNIQEEIKLNASKVDTYLNSYFKNQNSNSKLYEAMKYGLFSGGKMIRSYLVHAACKVFDIKEQDYLPIAAAIECVHSYSLIHDDLPSMDNDDFRRGKESTHKAYGEFTAILAGSSLLTMAFEMISDHNFKIPDEKKIKIIHALSFCSGHLGIAGGQFYDLSLEKEKVSQDLIIDMQNKKTGALMGFCTEVACILANKENERETFKDMGVKLGLLFQIADDFLDKYGKKETLGKPSQQDEVKGKNTLLSYLGEDKTKELVTKIKDEIENSLKQYSNTNALIDVMHYMTDRKS